MAGVAALVGLAGPALAQGTAPAPPPISRLETLPNPVDTLPARVTVSTDRRSLLIEGMLGRGTSARVRTTLAATRSIRTIVLHSGGGWVGEADDVARLVRAHAMDTYVETLCLSACTLILIAGRDRAAAPTARIGFHRPRWIGIRAAAQVPLQRAARALYSSAGIRPSFIDQVFATAHESMWYPGYEEMLAAGVLTRRTLGGETAAGLSSVATRADLAAMFEALPHWAPLKRRYPAVAEEIIDTAWAVRNRGGTDQEARAAVAPILSRMLPQIMRNASDAVVDAYLALALDQTVAARAVSDRACALHARGRLNIMVTLPIELARREMALLAEALDSPPRDAPAEDAEEATALIDEVLDRLPDDQVEAIVMIEEDGIADSLRCESAIALFRGVLAMEERKRRILGRYMFTAAD